MAGRISIVGAGALGRYAGSFLSRDGADATLVDVWTEYIDAVPYDN